MIRFKWERRNTSLIVHFLSLACPLLYYRTDFITENYLNTYILAN